MKSRSRLISTLVTGALCLMLVAVFPAFGEWRPDAWITTKVKIALLTTEGIESTGINVDTVDGRVTLHGTVESTAAKDHAEEAAREIDGVKEVRSLLQVVPKQVRQQLEKSDDALERQVTKALQAEPALEDSDISVQSVHNGAVLLGGTARSITDHLLAIQTVREVSGVQRVATEIRSPDETLDAAARAEEGSAPAGAVARDVSSTLSDAWITTSTKLRLVVDADAPALDINVDTTNGIVTLFGAVPSEKAKEAAEADARQVSGVKEVHNQLQVVPEAVNKAAAANDDQLRKAVQSALAKRPQLEETQIDVAIANGVARLTGTVQTQAQRLSAEVAVRSVAGVRSVINDLRLSDERQSMR